jgi:hypothetical protein
MQECRNKKSKRTHFLKSGIWNLKSISSKRTHFGQARGLAPTTNSEQRTKNCFIKTNPISPFFSKFQGSSKPVYLHSCIPVYLFSQNEPIFLQCLQFYSLSVQWCHGQYES